MVGTIVGATAAGAGQLLGGLAGDIIQGEYQKELQKRANDFTREQSQNQIKYNVQQMKDLGYSPSMLFGGGSGSVTSGGAGGGKNAEAPHFGTTLTQAFNTVGRILEQDSKNDLEERKLDLEQQKINNQIGIDRDYKATRNEYYKNYLENITEINKAKLNEQQEKKLLKRTEQKILRGI